jgi:mannan endo-1,4-beta-mannosidase
MTWLLRALLFLAVASGSAAGSPLAGVAPAQARAHDVALGAYIEGAAAHPHRIDRYGRLLGRDPVIVSEYAQWDARPFDPSGLDAVWRRGAVPMVTWEPLSYGGRRYTLRGIARGRYDGYLREAARTAARWDHPLLVRFAHEMNGNWYPWGRVDGNTPRRYKRAWRHVVRVFRRAGADNVAWVWTPYADQGGGMPFAAYYPGDRWVDWVGLDGFNWGYGGSDFGFRRIFGGSYRALARLSSRPVMIGETGTHGRGKPAWIRAALRSIGQMPRIRALVWFDAAANGVDLRFSRPRSALRAFRLGARRARFQMSRACLLRISSLPAPRGCGARRGG